MPLDWLIKNAGFRNRPAATRWQKMEKQASAGKLFWAGEW